MLVHSLIRGRKKIIRVDFVTHRRTTRLQKVMPSQDEGYGTVPLICTSEIENLRFATLLFAQLAVLF